jgi:hypothetical protein
MELKQALTDKEKEYGHMKFYALSKYIQNLEK